MTPRSLFVIILKIFGLYFVKEIVVSIPQVTPVLLLLTRGNESAGDGILFLFFTLIVLLFYSLVAYHLLFKPNYWVDRFKLDKGFEQTEFTLNMPISSVLTIALFVISGVILVNEIPFFCKQVYDFVQTGEERRIGIVKINFSHIIISIVKMIIALLLIGERKRIIAFIEERQNKNSDAE
jgi:NADH:ubiquinone oxidoreductase subunit 5 (subunit L)/multisubunit Na+/H+ antiporter MnhA subunit